MSKVPAHHELIDDIIKLRDEIAPQTLLTINGDIRNRVHGEELFAAHPGLNGIMIGRGVFSDPFCFRASRVVPQKKFGQLYVGPEFFSDGTRETNRKSAPTEETKIPVTNHKQELIKLLNYHLNLFDHYQPTLGRPFETLKRFFKIYIRDFDGAKELRDQLMNTKNTDEVRQLINSN